MLLQLPRQLFGVGVAQIPHLRVAAIFERRVEMSDQRPQAQTFAPVTADQDAVGPGIGNHADRDRHAIRSRRLGQCSQYANHLGGRCVRQRHDLDVVVVGLVDAPDDADHAFYIQ